MGRILRPEPITLFLAGDLMLGRGVDQIFPVSCRAGLHQPFSASALTYVELAEKANGRIPRPVDYRRFARLLVDRAGVDLVHGHSSHYPRPLEVYEDRLILYGCGDFLNDYEGIGLYERYRGDLVIMYFPIIDPSTGKLLELQMTPLRIRRFRLEHPPLEDVEWLHETLNREYQRLGSRVSRTGEGRLVLS